MRNLKRTLSLVLASRHACGHDGYRCLAVSGDFNDS